MVASEAMQSTSIRKAVILTALSVEFRAVRNHLTGSQEEIHSAGTVYERGSFQAESGTWDVLLVETGAGNARAALEVERAIQYFAPEVAIFVGVAGGLKDVAIGDVVFASKVYGYEAGKASGVFEPRTDTGESSYALLQRARAVARNVNWLDRLSQPIESPQPRAWLGPIAAGEKVISETRSPEYQFLRQQHGDALAVEMEGRGFLTATWANQHVEALVIRGISDLIAGKSEADSQGSQALASRHASAFAFEVLAKFVLPARQPVTAAPRHLKRAQVWMVPFPRNPNFTGRAPLLQAIHAHFLTNPSRPTPLALFGLGGVGKTQLAMEYASQHTLDERNHSHVLWLRSDEPSVLASSYAALTHELNLPEKSEPDLQLKIRAVQQWLQWNEGWLLVFDNAENPGVVRPYLPLAHRGHVLITSRNATWGELATSFPVQVLDRAESIEFLRRRTGHDDAQAASALAEALGDLPLALAQAAAYTEQKGKSLSGYLALFEQRRQELLARPAAPADYPYTVAATWDISLEQVRAQSPAAVDLLALCAFLASSPLPIAWLAESAEVLPSPLSQVLRDELQLDEALGTLRRYSLVQFSQQELLLHRLVQAVMLARVAEERGTWAEAALRFMHKLFDFDTNDVKTRVLGAALLPHALAAARNAWELRRGLQFLPELLSRMGYFWEELAEFDSAHHTFQWGLTVTRELHGENHVAEAEFLQGIASVELDLGKLKESQEHTEQALRLIQSAPEKDPHRVDESGLLNQLAHVFLRRGALREARECAEKALALRTAARKEYSSDVELPSTTLGAVLLRQARFAEALVHFESALKEAEARLGGSHIVVAAAVGNLAGVLEQLGRYGEARAQLERGLKVFETTYGPDHPKVAAFLRSLGDLHLRLGDSEKAQICCERALRIDEERLGPQHLDVAADLNNLARVHHERGDLQTARSYFERALAIEEHELGLRHIGLATVLDNLGRVHEELGELKQARTCFERSLAIYEHEHATDHPDIANVLNNLGHLLESMGDLPRARECLERAVAIDEQAYGPHHPEVAIDLSNLASILSRQGEQAQAEQHLQRALAIHEERSGTNPAEYILGLMGLSQFHHDRKQWDKAKPHLERALQEQEKMDPHSPRVADLLGLLGETLLHLGEDEAALACLERARRVPKKTRNGAGLLQLLIYQCGALRHLGRTQEALVQLEELERLALEVNHESLRGLAFLELGRVHHQAGSLDKARGYIERALKVERGEEEDWFAKATYDLARVLEDAQDLHEARLQYEQALRLGEVRHGKESQPVVTILQALGHVLLKLGEHNLALEQLARALAVYEQNLGPEDPAVAEVLHTMAMTWLGAGKLHEAERLASRALTIHMALTPPRKPELASLLLFLGQVHESTGSFEQARVAYERALQFEQEELGPDHLLPTLTLVRIGRCLVAQEHHLLAKSYLEQALKLGESSVGSHHALVRAIRRYLGSALLALGEFEAAQTCMEHNLEDQEIDDYSYQEKARDLLNLASVSWAKGEKDSALQGIEQALALCRGSPDGELPFLGALCLQAEILIAQEMWAEARVILEEVLRHEATELLPPKERCALHNRLGISLFQLGHHKLALVQQKKALAFVTRFFGRKHPQYAVMQYNIAITLGAAGKTNKAVNRLKHARRILEDLDPGHPLLKTILERLEQLSDEGD